MGWILAPTAGFDPHLLSVKEWWDIGLNFSAEKLFAKGSLGVEIKSTLMVVNEEEVEPREGVTAGQTVKAIVGSGERPADRIRVALASFEAGTLERLHWHPIEAFYFVISGRATVRDLEGNEYDAGPGTSIYAPAGIAGAHEWEVREPMRLLSVRGCTDSAKKMQFTVEKDTKRSYIDLDELIRREGVSFESHY
jgi:quercetin dioxygenase-like cupin family protein